MTGRRLLDRTYTVCVLGVVCRRDTFYHCPAREWCWSLQLSTEPTDKLASWESEIEVGGKPSSFQKTCDLDLCVEPGLIRIDFLLTKQ